MSAMIGGPTIRDKIYHPDSHPFSENPILRSVPVVDHISLSDTERRRLLLYLLDPMVVDLTDEIYGDQTFVVIFLRGNRHSMNDGTAVQLLRIDGQVMFSMDANKLDLDLGEIHTPGSVYTAIGCYGRYSDMFGATVDEWGEPLDKKTLPLDRYRVAVQMNPVLRGLLDPAP